MIKKWSIEAINVDNVSKCDFFLWIVNALKRNFTRAQCKINIIRQPPCAKQQPLQHIHSPTPSPSFFFLFNSFPHTVSICLSIGLNNIFSYNLVVFVLRYHLPPECKVHMIKNFVLFTVETLSLETVLVIQQELNIC